MSRLVLVDTSTWTQALRRKGDAMVCAKIARMLATGSAAWCEIVRLELWNGVRGEIERRGLEEMDRTIPRLPITLEVWEMACTCALKARRAGLNVPSNDLVIFACARFHAVAIEHIDRHFDLLDHLAPV